MEYKDLEAFQKPILTALSTSVTQPSCTETVVKSEPVEGTTSVRSPGNEGDSFLAHCKTDVAERRRKAGTCLASAAQLQESTCGLEPGELKAQKWTYEHFEMKSQACLQSDLYQKDPSDMHVSGAYEGVVLQDWTAKADESDYTAKKAEPHRNFSHVDGGGSVFDEPQKIPGERLPVLSISKDFEETEVEGARHVVLPTKKEPLEVDADDDSDIARASPDRQGESLIPRANHPVLSIPKGLEETKVENARRVALPTEKRPLKVGADDGSVVQRASSDRQGVSHIPASSYRLEGENVPMDIHVMRESYQRKEEVFNSHGGEGWSSTLDHPALSPVHRSARAMRPAMLGAGTHTEGGSFPQHTMTRVESASHETTADVNDSIQNESCCSFTPHMDITRSFCTSSSKPMYSTDIDVVIQDQKRESLTPAKARRELMSHPLDVVQLQVQHDAGGRATGTFSCPHCQKSLSSKNGLIKHIRWKHDDRKKHICSHCRGMFISPRHLKVHIKRVHEKIRPYVCNQSSKTFFTEDELNKHMSRPIVHDQDNKYICLVCGVKFSQKCHLKRHSETLHGNVSHKCPTCAETFLRIDNLKRHMARAHDATLRQSIEADTGRG